MALNIRNLAVEALIDEIVALTGESKTEAVRKALEDRRKRLALHVVAPSRASKLRAVLEQEIWPMVPDHERGRRLSKAEEEAILGLDELGA